MTAAARKACSKMRAQHWSDFNRSATVLLSSVTVHGTSWEAPASFQNISTCLEWRWMFCILSANILTSEFSKSGSVDACERRMSSFIMCFYCTYHKLPFLGPQFPRRTSFACRLLLESQWLSNLFFPGQHWDSSWNQSFQHAISELLQWLALFGPRYLVLWPWFWASLEVTFQSYRWCLLKRCISHVCLYVKRTLSNLTKPWVAPSHLGPLRNTSRKTSGYHSGSLCSKRSRWMAFLRGTFTSQSAEIYPRAGIYSNTRLCGAACPEMLAFELKM